MKTTCTINNYNYARYVGEAIQSVLDQTVAFDEIIVVDDGSTDNSLEVIERCIKNCKNAKVIAKRNEGQLSCFNEGFKASSGDLIYFLDADDIYLPNYLETTLHFYNQTTDCDFLCCSVQEFGKSDSLKNYVKSEDYCKETGDMGYSLLRTLYYKNLIGSVTSSLSMKRIIIKKILPLPFLEEWRTRADDCLVLGSSLVGARKYFIPQPLIKYRVHENNYWRNKAYSLPEKLRRRLAIEQLMKYILTKNYYPSDLCHLSWLEYRTVPNPDYKKTKFYLHLAGRSSLYKYKGAKRRIKRKILKRYLKTRIWKTKQTRAHFSITTNMKHSRADNE